MTPALPDIRGMRTSGAIIPDLPEQSAAKSGNLKYYLETVLPCFDADHYFACLRQLDAAGKPRDPDFVFYFLSACSRFQLTAVAGITAWRTLYVRYMGVAGITDDANPGVIL